ncbi:MAG: acyltransferase [Bacteroidota bacterium]
MLFSRLHHTLNDPKRLQSLDFIRGVVTISVFLTHFGISEFYNVEVDTFFILSGFLATRSLCYESENVNRRYMIRRAVRIFPSYYFFLVAAFLIGYFFLRDVYGDALPKLSEWKEYVFFYRNYAGPPNRWAFEYVWSLCVEEHFYILILFVSLSVGSRVPFRRRVEWFAYALLVGSVGLKVQAIITLFAEYPTFTHNRLDNFAYGILIFLYQDRLRDSGLWRNLPLFILCFLGLGVTISLTNPENVLILRILSPLFLSGMMIFLMGFRFYSRWIRVVAFYSYNTYLWHFFLVIPIQYYFPNFWVGFTVYTLLTACCAFLTTHFVEGYFSRKLRPRV